MGAAAARGEVQQPLLLGSVDDDAQAGNRVRLTSVVVAAPLIPPRHVEADHFLVAESEPRLAQTVRAFHAPLVVVECETVHSNKLDPALRVVEESRHRVGQRGIAVPGLADTAAGRDPYVCIRVAHQRQECLTSFVGPVRGLQARAETGGHRSPDAGVVVADVRQEGRFGTRLGVRIQAAQHLYEDGVVRLLGRPVSVRAATARTQNSSSWLSFDVGSGGHMPSSTA